jgi:hypothetical protein
LEGQADATIPLNVNLTDGVSDITPTSVALTGNDLDIVIPPPSTPSGVLFKTIEPSQYTSYRTGDEGWRVQNNWYDYTPPSNPKAVAELDYTQTNYVDVLKNPLIVNGVSNTHRFVNVFGALFGTGGAGNNTVVIDKLTGMAYLNNAATILNWNGAIDYALTYSITVHSINFSDWYLASKNELLNIARDFAGTAFFNLIGGTALINAGTNLYSSTTYAPLTTSMLHFRFANYDFSPVTKGNTGLSVPLIENVRHLITAP